MVTYLMEEAKQNNKKSNNNSQKPTNVRDAMLYRLARAYEFHYCTASYPMYKLGTLLKIGVEKLCFWVPSVLSLFFTTVLLILLKIR